MLCLVAVDWAKAHASLEHGIAVLRAGNVRFSFPQRGRLRRAMARLGEANEALNRLREA